MSMTNVNRNAVPMESNTTLTLCVLIDGKEILPQALQNERDAADAICCLLPGATLDDILERFKWLYGSVESSDPLMQEFYRIM